MIKIESKYQKLVELLGGCPEEQNGNVVCHPTDFNDALENLMVYMDDDTLLAESADIKAELASLGMRPKEALKELIIEEAIRWFIRKNYPTLSSSDINDIINDLKEEL